MVDDAAEDVGCGFGILEIADLVDVEDMRLDAGRGRLAQRAGTCGRAKLVDVGRRTDESGLESVLDGSVGQRDGDVRLSEPRLAGQDPIAPLGHELRPDVVARSR